MGRKRIKPQPSFLDNIPPFTQEELDAFSAALYIVNSTNQCINPSSIYWAKGLQHFQNRQRFRRRKS